MPRRRDILIAFTGVLAAACVFAPRATAEPAPPCDPYIAAILSQPPDGDVPLTGMRIAISGDTAIAGAPLLDPLGAAIDSGGAFVYRRAPGNTWALEAILSFPDADISSQIGDAVAIDGDTAVLGARFRRGRSGEVFVYTRTTDPATGDVSWSLQANIKPTEPGAFFGQDVAIQGDTLFISHPASVSAPEGSIVIFQRTNGQWRFATRIRAQGAQPNDFFGYAIDLSGSWLAVNVPLEDNGLTTGAVYIFEGQGDTWVQRAHVTAPEGLLDERLAAAVAIEDPYLVFGSIEAAGGIGRVWVYKRSGLTWTLEQTLAPPPDPAGGASRFGASVEIHNQRILVGAPFWNDSGAAFGFEKRPAGWQRTVDLIAQSLSTGPLDLYDLGRDVSIDGSWAIASAPYTYPDDVPEFPGAVLAVQWPQVPLAITAEPQPMGFDAPGPPATLSIEVDAPGPVTYQWFKDGEPLVDSPRITGAQAPVLHIEPTTLEDQGVYWCQVGAQDCGERRSIDAPIFFRPCLQLTQQPESLVINGGDEATFVLQVEGFEPRRYIWFRNGVRVTNDPPRVTGATTPTLRLRTTTPSDAGEYFCIISAACLQTFTKAVTLSFSPCAAVTSHPPALVTAYETQRITLSAQVSGGPSPVSTTNLITPAVITKWLRNSAPLEDDGRITGSDTTTLTINNASLDDSGEYQLFVSCAFTADRSPPTILAVGLRPCLGDASRDRRVNLADVSAVLGNWGRVYTDPDGQNFGDASFDAVVNFADLPHILANWGDVCGP